MAKRNHGGAGPRGFSVPGTASAERAFVGRRAGRPESDWEVRTLAGAVVGVAMAVMFALAEDPAADLATSLDAAMAA